MSADNTYDDALLNAAASGNTDELLAALGNGANLEARDSRQRTALLLAASNDHVEAARILVEKGADVNAVDDQKDTPWLVTGVTGSVEMGKVLLEGKPNMKLRNRYGGITPIPAAERGHVEYIEWVATTGIDLDHVNDLGWTALLEAVILGDGGPRHQQTVKALVNAGVNTSIADKDGVTALEHAQKRGYKEIVALLQAE